mgnify:CR=1 FL=1
MADIDHQPRHDLAGAEAGQKIKDIAGDARMCMFATDVTNFPGDVRPMAIQKVDEDGNGLAGLTARVQTAGGTCRYGHDDHHVFHLDVAMPWIACQADRMKP